MIERLRRHPVRYAILVLALVTIVSLAWAVVGLARLPGHAEASAANLRAAKQLASDNDFEGATQRADEALAQARQASDAAENPWVRVGSALPVVGSALSDVRHLSSALVDAAQMGSDGLSALNELRPGGPRPLVEDRQVHLGELHRLRELVTELLGRTKSAQQHLGQVRGDAPWVGTRLATARDQASAQLPTVERGLEQAESALTVLPEMLGEKERKFYVLALLNPAELKYSGGSTLALGRIEADNGRVIVKVRDGIAPKRRGYRAFMRWEPVKGNPFHSFLWQRLRITHATMNPNWSISGEEFLRASAKQARAKQADGLLAIDVQAMAALLQVTGPIKTDGYPLITADNAVAELVGNYDQYPDNAERHRHNRQFITAFRDALFESADLKQTYAILRDAALRREFAVVLSPPVEEVSPQTQALRGDLSDSSHDYSGVFTQSLEALKSDYWSSRAISREVSLRSDGSALVQQKVIVSNDSPPYAGPGEDVGKLDPLTAIYTRWQYYNLGAWLPKGVKIQQAAVDGVPVTLPVRKTRGRPFVEFLDNELPRGAAKTFTLDYVVPQAAVVDGDTMRYRFDYDPQATVIPPRLAVSVKFPKGFRPQPNEQGWTVKGQQASYENPDAVESSSWEVVATRD